jgi:hypothetical protein
LLLLLRIIITQDYSGFNNLFFVLKNSETRYQELLYILRDIINIKNLAENKLERETKILEFEIKKRFNKSRKK